MSAKTPDTKTPDAKTSDAKTPDAKTPDAKTSDAKKKPSRELPFEDAVKRLSEIVQQLERGDLPLEASLLLFEEGVKLSRASQQTLDSAQKRVEELLGLDRDGKPNTAPFETRAEGDER